jgi:hypothetical protein
MTRLPQLEAQLVTAAGRQSRSRRPLLLAAGALAVAACVLVAALLLAPDSRPREQPVQAPETVPAQTLVKARALREQPRLKSEALPVAELGAFAERQMAQIPYPPGLSDHFNWAARHDIKRTDEIQGLAQYRAYCLWMQYWLRGADRAGASAVIATIPRWPGQRQENGYETYWQRKLQTAVRTGDVATVRQEVVTNCDQVR